MLFDNAINSKKQGDIGMCYAMAYYAKLGWTVSVPVTDSQDYDLVVDNGTRLFKVQVKTTKSISPSGNYVVNRRTMGGNLSGAGKYKDFSENSSDLLFALTDSGDCYSIPKSEISAVNAVALGERYLPYRVTLH